MVNRTRFCRRSMAIIITTLTLPAQLWAQAAPRTGSRSVNGIELHFQEWGSGEPLVLLHGFGGCADHWTAFAERFADGYRVIAPDMRAHGRSTGEAGSFTHRQAATDVLALMDALGVDHFRAIGYSSGGLVLLNMATRAPERVDAMVLVSTTHRVSDEVRSAMAAIERGVAVDGGQNLRAMMRDCAARGEPQVDALLGRWFELDDVQGDAVADLLGRIRARTLVMSGDRDEFFSVELAIEMYRGIPDAALWILPFGYHDVLFTPMASSFVDIVGAFLRGELAEPGTGPG